MKEDLQIVENDIKKTRDTFFKKEIFSLTSVYHTELDLDPEINDKK